MADPRSAQSERIVFDPRLWGGKDRDNNEHCWQRASILEVMGSGPRQIATVRFHHDGRRSTGHFTAAMRDA